MTYEYNALGMPTTLTGATTYVTKTAYDFLGRLGSMGTSDGGGKTFAQIWSYELGTKAPVK